VLSCFYWAALEQSAMLQRTSKNATECHRRATLCAERAKHALNSDDRYFHLSMAQRWLSLAGSYEFSNRLAITLDHLDRSKNKAE
jgi:hypothetical protein